MQLVEAEHREGEHDEHQRKTAQHPGILQGGGKQRPGHAGRDAGGGIGDRHAQHVGQREGEAAAAGNLVALSGDDAGKDGNHREDARRQRQTQPGDEEKQEIGEKTGVLQGFGDFSAFITARLAGFGHRRAGRIGQVDGDHLCLRRVADTGIGAALRTHLELDGQRARGGSLHRQADHRFLVVNLDLAEVLVHFLLALGQDRHAGPGGIAVDGELDLVLVEVIVAGDVEADLDGLTVQRPRRCLEGDGRIEEFLGMGQRSQEGEEE